MLLFIESFDHLSTADLSSKWTAVNEAVIISGVGRNGTQGLHLPTNIRKTLATGYDTLIIGFALKSRMAAETSGLNPTGALIQFQSTGAHQAFIKINPDYTLSVYDGNSVLLGTTAASIQDNVWIYLEAKVKFHATTGTVDIRLNGVSALSLTAKNTNVVGSGVANSIVIGINPGQTFVANIDDVYIANNDGVGVTAFLGDTMIGVLRPDGAGDNTEWSPAAGSNYANVADTLQDGDASYNYANVAGKLDMYTMSNLLSSPAAIYGVQWNAFVRKTDAASYLLKSALKSSTVQLGPLTFSPGTGYQDLVETYQFNPDTGVAWTLSEVNAMQAGIKLNSIV